MRFSHYFTKPLLGGQINTIEERTSKAGPTVTFRTRIIIEYTKHDDSVFTGNEPSQQPKSHSRRFSVPYQIPRKPVASQYLDRSLPLRPNPPSALPIATNSDKVETTPIHAYVNKHFPLNSDASPTVNSPSPSPAPLPRRSSVASGLFEETPCENWRHSPYAHNPTAGLLTIDTANATESTLPKPLPHIPLDQERAIRRLIDENDHTPVSPVSPISTIGAWSVAPSLPDMPVSEADRVELGLAKRGRFYGMGSVKRNSWFGSGGWKGKGRPVSMVSVLEG